ncbi:MAG TPA: NAD(P)-dependent alcohol dehydrogenase [Gammaproteobacteria bacterium]
MSTTIDRIAPGRGIASEAPRTYTVAAYAAQGPTAALAPTSIPRREPGPRDVQIDILYCGVCHSDLHQVRNEWDAMPTVYPCVPGHEIVGRVAHVGDEVRKFDVGDLVAVGCMVDSCRTCSACEAGLEQYCERGPTFTYNSEDEHLGGVTYGGYSTSIVVDEAFVLSVPRRRDLAAVAPLLCAGITTYSPLRHWGVGPGHKVGIVGLGGLGHMGVKFASAFGAHVVVFTRSKAKAAEALRLGADDVVISADPVAMRAHARSFDFILDTVSAKHELNPYLELLRRDGTLTLVGAPSGALSVSPFKLLLGRHRLAGSGIGGIAETQEMLDFCAEHRITADVEIVDIQRIEEAFARLLAGDVRYRFVIDMASLRGASA